MDYNYFGSTPTNETPTETSDPHYNEKAKKECAAYVNQLYRILSLLGYPKNTLPKNFVIRPKAEPRAATENLPAGYYYEVVAKHSDEVSKELAELIEDNLPELWDDEAKKELGI